MIRNSKTFGEKTHSWTPCRPPNCWSNSILCDKENMCHQFIRQVKNISNFFFWHNQSMSEIMLVESEKRETEFIFVYFIAWDFSLNNFSKNGGHRKNILCYFHDMDYLFYERLVNTKNTTERYFGFWRYSKKALSGLFITEKLS